MIFAGKKVLVFGTGKSGIAAEDLLHKKGASVVLYDGNDKLEKEEILKKLESRDSVEVVLGELPEEMLDSLDLVVLSPGVPTDLPVVLKMKEKEIPVIGEVELALILYIERICMYDRSHTSCKEHTCKCYDKWLNIQIRYQKSLYQPKSKSNGKCNQERYKHISALEIQIYRAAHTYKCNDTAD